MIHLTKAEYLLQWLLYAVCIFVYAFFLFRTFQYASVYFFFFLSREIYHAFLHECREFLEQAYHSSACNLTVGELLLLLAN